MRRGAPVLSFMVLALAGCERAPERQADGAAAGYGAAPAEAPAPAVMDVAAPEAASRALRAKAAPPPVAPSSAAIPTPQDVVVAPSMVIRTGTAMLEVDSLEPGIAEVQLLAARVGGYIANTSIQVGNEQFRSATLDLKIPAQRFDEAVGGLRSLGEVEAVNVTAEDVGEEFVDITARVTNARRLEERLVRLLETRTGRLEDVLAVERELARVREEIERHEGRLRYLRTRAAVSTLSVTLHEPRPIVGRQGGSSVIGEAFRDMWRNFVGFVAGLIAALGFLLPLLAIVAGIAFLVRRFWKPRGGGAAGA